jgi:hypothetical protein
MRESSGVGRNSKMMYLTRCKKLFKCHNVPTLSPTVKKKSGSPQTF